MEFQKLNISDQLGICLLSRDSLALRALVHETIRAFSDIGLLPNPTSEDLSIRAAAASIAELLAERAGQQAAAWTSQVAALGQPLYVLKNATRMENLRLLCERESPSALKKRGFLAPPDFLKFA